MNSKTIFVLVTDSFGDGGIATREQLQSLLDDHNRQEEAYAEHEGREFVAPYFADSIGLRGYQLRLYRSEKPGDYEVVGYQYSENPDVLDPTLISDLARQQLIEAGYNPPTPKEDEEFEPIDMSVFNE